MQGRVCPVRLRDLAPGRKPTKFDTPEARRRKSDFSIKHGDGEKTCDGEERPAQISEGRKRRGKAVRRSGKNQDFPDHGRKLSGMRRGSRRGNAPSPREPLLSEALSAKARSDANLEGRHVPLRETGAESLYSLVAGKWRAGRGNHRKGGKAGRTSAEPVSKPEARPLTDRFTVFCSGSSSARTTADASIT